DVVLQSSDGKILGAHAGNLEMFSCGFPPASLTASSPSFAADSVCLTETADVLEVLLGFMHNRPQQNLLGYPSNVITALAEAAEKYLVHPAMEVCRLHMFRLADIRPKEVFAYALKHGYSELLDKTAPMTLTWDTKTACKALGVNGFAIWVLYREEWFTLYHNLPSLTAPVKRKRGVKECGHWDRFLVQIVEMGVRGLMRWKEQIPLLVSKVDCKWCRQRASNLQSNVERAIMNLPSASELIKGL
ncbi:hypothetical protein AMATHDRAFT_149626, partial [Amanita thiersii Skay4041]